MGKKKPAWAGLLVVGHIGLVVEGQWQLISFNWE